MANNASKTDQTAPAVDVNTLLALVQQMVAQSATFGDAVRQIAAGQPRRRVTTDEFIRRRPKRPETVTLVQNGREVDIQRIDEAAYKLLPKLRSGLFVDGRVRVAKNAASDPPVVRIKYPCASVKSRMENGNHFRNFTELITRLATEEPIKLSE